MKTLLLTASFAAVGIVSPVSAQPAPARMAVSTAGLDLATAAGQHELDLRILHASSALCGTPSPADGRGRAAYEQCRAEARATAATGRARALALAQQQSPTEVATNR